MRTKNKATNRAYSGQYVTITTNGNLVKGNIRKGMMILGMDSQCKSVYEFKVDIPLDTREVVVHCHNLCQVARVSKNKLTFKYRPEYIAEGMRVIINDKLGTVIKTSDTEVQKKLIKNTATNNITDSIVQYKSTDIQSTNNNNWKFLIFLTVLTVIILLQIYIVVQHI